MAAVQYRLAQQPSVVVLQRDSHVQFSADVTVQKTAATNKLNHLPRQMRIRVKTNDDILGLSRDWCGYVSVLDCRLFLSSLLLVNHVHCSV